MKWTTKENDLSQWRAYGGGTQGYRTGFQRQLLNVFRNANMGSFYPCIYEPEDQRQILREMIEGCTDQVFQARSEERSSPWQLQVWQAVARYGACIKHEDFKVEHEWRFVHSQIWPAGQMPPHQSPKVQYRNSARGLTPYVQLALPQPSAPEMHGFNIRIGPGPVSDSVKSTLQSYLSSFNYQEVQIEKGTSPVR